MDPRSNRVVGLNGSKPRLLLPIIVAGQQLRHQTDYVLNQTDYGTIYIQQPFGRAKDQTEITTAYYCRRATTSTSNRLRPITALYIYNNLLVGLNGSRSNRDYYCLLFDPPGNNFDIKPITYFIIILQQLFGWAKWIQDGSKVTSCKIH
jgi:hypothetical protein